MDEGWMSESMDNGIQRLENEMGEDIWVTSGNAWIRKRKMEMVGLE